MTDGLRPYPEYRDSGVPRMGRVPTPWTVQRLKWVCRFAYGDSLPSTLRIPGDVPVYGSNGRIGGHGESNTLGPCIIVGRKGSFGKIKYSETPVFAIDTTYYVDSRHSEAVLRWLYYVLSWLDLDDTSRDSAIPGLDRGDAYDRQVPLPSSICEQATIANCLDAATARSHRFIRNRRRLIALLNEQKQAVINQAVRRGLDPNVRLKPSGVDWLGDIPEHWEVRRIKEICRLSYGDSLPIGLRGSGPICVFGSNGRVGEHCEANTTGPCLVIGRKGSFGKVNYSADPVFAIDTTFFVDTRFTKADLRWLFYVLQWARLDAVSKDAAIPGLSRNDAYAMPLPYCGADEQGAIAAYLESRLETLNRLQSAASGQIDLIREYRSRLISDVVTGKLDVRGLAAGLEDEPIEPEDLSDDIDSGDMPEEDELALVQEAADADE